MQANADTGTDEADASAPGSCLALRVDGGAACTRAVVPSPPAALADQPGNGRTYVLAARRIEIGPSSFGNWRQIGFDLDGICSDSTGGSPRSCTAAQTVVDGDDGRDNAFGSAVATGLHVMDTFRDMTLSETMAAGRLTVGVRITEWGGGDDRRVSFEWLHLVEGRGASGSTLNWDGMDRWKIEPSYSLATDRMTTAIRSSDGFVACGYSVARLPSRVPVVLLSGTQQRLVTLRSTVLAGAFDPVNGGIADAAGVWVREDIVQSLPWFGVCPPPNGPMDVFNDRVSGIERNFDIREDFVPAPMMPCTAATIALRFELRPVQLDGVATTALPTIPPCTADAGM